MNKKNKKIAKIRRSRLKNSAHLEVRDELGGTLPKRAKEHNLATFLEEEERVKHLEQVRGWLMDRADHRALRGRHLPDSSHHHLPVRRHSRARNGTGRGRR